MYGMLQRFAFCTFKMHQWFPWTADSIYKHLDKEVKDSIINVIRHSLVKSVWENWRQQDQIEQFRFFYQYLNKLSDGRTYSLQWSSIDIWHQCEYSHWKGWKAHSEQKTEHLLLPSLAFSQGCNQKQKHHTSTLPSLNKFFDRWKIKSSMLYRPIRGLCSKNSRMSLWEFSFS